MARGPYSIENRDIPLLIRECRIAAGLTQEQLAEAVDASQATVARWERGEVDLSVRKLMHIAVILDVPVSALIKQGDGLSVHERRMVEDLRAHPKHRHIIESTLRALQDTNPPQGS